MTNEAMSPLRRRMIEDMTIRGFGAKTQHDYIRSISNLAKFLGRSPDTASNEDVRRFQLHLSSEGISAANMNGTVSGLRFFFRVTLGRVDIASHLPFVRQPRKLPVVLSLRRSRGSWRRRRGSSTRRRSAWRTAPACARPR
jgi:integrase/recombinase XerD